MPTIKQLAVMDQTSIAGGFETCGYHALKNSVLALLRIHNIINEQRFDELRNDKEFFKAIYNATVVYHSNRFYSLLLDKLRGGITPQQRQTLTGTERNLYTDVFYACYDNVDKAQGHLDAAAIIQAMRNKQAITDEQLQLLQNDVALLDKINNAAIRLHKERNTDLAPARFGEILLSAQRGELALPGIPTENLKKLNLTLDGTQEVTAVSCELNMHQIEHGLSLAGLDVDLAVAAATAKLARSKGATHHAFAYAIERGNSSHWVTAVVVQNDKGERTWQFMDSYGNQSTYKNTIVNRIERILTKDEAQLSAYLIQAYDNTTTNLEPFLHRLNLLPNPPRAYTEEDKREHFVNSAETLITQLEARFNFMKNSGWLENPGDEEKQRIQSLYQIANYLNTTTPRVDIKERLKPICNGLNSTLAPPVVDEVDNDVIHDDKGVNVVDDKANQPITVGGDKKDGPVVDVEEPKVDINDKKTTPIVQGEKPKAVIGDKKDGPAVDVKEPKVDINDKKETPIVPVDKPRVKKPKINIEPPKPKIIGEDVDDKPKDKAAKQKQDDDVKIQQRQAGDAVKNGTPKPTEGLISQLVKGIKFLWEGIKSAVGYVARAIGIVH